MAKVSDRFQRNHSETRFDSILAQLETNIAKLQRLRSEDATEDYALDAEYVPILTFPAHFLSMMNQLPSWSISEHGNTFGGTCCVYGG